MNMKYNIKLDHLSRKGKLWKLNLITDVSDVIMHQLPYESTRLLNILFKNLWMVPCTQLQ